MPVTDLERSLEKTIQTFPLHMNRIFDSFAFVFDAVKIEDDVAPSS